MNLHCQFRPQFRLNSKRFAYDVEKPHSEAPKAAALQPDDLDDLTDPKLFEANKALANEFIEKFHVQETGHGKIVDFKYKQLSSEFHCRLLVGNDDGTITVTKENLTEKKENPSLAPVVQSTMSFRRFNDSLKKDTVRNMPELRKQLEANRDAIVIRSHLATEIDLTLAMYRHFALNGVTAEQKAQIIAQAIDTNVKNRLLDLQKKGIKIKGFKTDVFPWTKVIVNVADKNVVDKEDIGVDSSFTKRWVLEWMAFATLRDNYAEKKYANFDDFKKAVDEFVKKGLPATGEQKASIYFNKNWGNVQFTLKEGKVTGDYAALQDRILKTERVKNAGINKPLPGTP